MAVDVAWNELQLLARQIARARRQSAPDLLVAPPNDAVVLDWPQSRGALAVCVDATIEGVHFERSAAPRAVGWKACARALSDLAATGARPRGVLLALSAPRATSQRWLSSALGGVERCAARYGAQLLGGDTSASHGSRALTVCAVGRIERTWRALGRDGGRPGDLLVSSGAFGGSSLGRHLRFAPRFEAARAFVRAGARAMLDVSDGLALDAWRLAEASRVRLDLERVPVHRSAFRVARAHGRTPVWHALFDGEDYELLALLPPQGLARARRAWPGLELLGRARVGAGLWVASELAREAELSAQRGRSGGASFVRLDPRQQGYVHGR